MTLAPTAHFVANDFHVRPSGNAPPEATTAGSTPGAAQCRTQRFTAALHARLGPRTAQLATWVRTHGVQVPMATTTSPETCGSGWLIITIHLPIDAPGQLTVNPERVKISRKLRIGSVPTVVKASPEQTQSPLPANGYCEAEPSIIQPTVCGQLIAFTTRATGDCSWRARVALKMTPATTKQRPPASAANTVPRRDCRDQ